MQVWRPEQPALASAGPGLCTRLHRVSSAASWTHLLEQEVEAARHTKQALLAQLWREPW